MNVKTHRNSSKPRSGFTLIELLVVIVIIATLAALGFTGTQRMLDSASKTKAIGHLRQLNTLFHQYSTDQNGAILHHAKTEATIDGVTRERSWGQYLLLMLSPELGINQNYEKSIGDTFALNAGIFTDPKALKVGKAAGNFKTSGERSWRTFAYNNRIGTPKVAFPGELGYAVGAKFTHQVETPDKLMLFAQKRLEPGGFYTFVLQPNDFSADTINFKLYNGSTMVNFFDGSVAFYKKAEFPSLVNNNPRTGSKFTQPEVNEYFLGRATTFPAP